MTLPSKYLWIPSENICHSIKKARVVQDGTLNVITGCGIIEVSVSENQIATVKKGPLCIRCFPARDAFVVTGASINDYWYGSATGTVSAIITANDYYPLLSGDGRLFIK